MLSRVPCAALHLDGGDAAEETGEGSKGAAKPPKEGRHRGGLLKKWKEKLLGRNGAFCARCAPCRGCRGGIGRYGVGEKSRAAAWCGNRPALHVCAAPGARVARQQSPILRGRVCASFSGGCLRHSAWTLSECGGGSQVLTDGLGVSREEGRCSLLCWCAGKEVDVAWRSAWSGVARGGAAAMQVCGGAGPGG